MSSLARIAAMSILLFAVGVGLGLVDAGTVDAQPGNGGQRLTPRPGAQLVLEIDRPASEGGPVRSAATARGRWCSTAALRRDHAGGGPRARALGAGMTY
jgi:hypothetical protein